MSKGLPKLNLQLFGDSNVLEGVDSSIPNPITADVSNDVATDVSTNSFDTNVDTGANNVDTGVGNNTKQPDYSDLSSKIDALMQKMNKPEMEDVKPQAEEPKTLTEEEIEQLNNDFYNKFTEKPLDALKELIEERANEKIAPIQQYFDNIQKMNYWNEQIDNFEKDHPDFKEYVADVSQLIQSDETVRNSKNPLEYAYKLVKADKLEAKIKPIDEQLKDGDTLKELLKNPEIKNLIFQQLKAEKENIPRVIGTDGTTSVNVEDKPKSIESATKAWLNS